MWFATLKQNRRCWTWTYVEEMKCSKISLTIYVMFVDGELFTSTSPCIHIAPAVHLSQTEIHKTCRSTKRWGAPLWQHSYNMFPTDTMFHLISWNWRPSTMPHRNILIQWTTPFLPSCLRCWAVESQVLWLDVPYPGLYSLIDRTSYQQISRSPEAARCGFRVVRSL